MLLFWFSDFWYFKLPIIALREQICVLDFLQASSIAIMRSLYCFNGLSERYSIIIVITLELLRSNLGYFCFFRKLKNSIKVYGPITTAYSFDGGLQKQTEYAKKT